jgi:hypothetical protein
VTRASEGVHATDSLSSQASVNRAARENAFYDCLGDQVRKLVPSGANVAIGNDPETSQGMSLLSVVIPWAHVAANVEQANVVLRLEPRSGESTCSGLAVVASPGGER